MKTNKRPISSRIEAELLERIELIALADRRSLADVVAECVKRAVPILEQELQQPRFTPEMLAQLRAGKSVADVLAARLAPFATTPPAPELPARDKKPAAKKPGGGGGARFDVV